MRRYRVFHVEISYTDVVAHSPEEALEIAEGDEDRDWTDVPGADDMEAAELDEPLGYPYVRWAVHRYSA